jgi:hypothetical protein
MQTAEYTADAICRALGLPALQESGASWCARLLLKPSFDPELCITFAKRDDGCVAEVRASHEHLWALHGWRGVQERFALEEVAAPCEIVEQLLDEPSVPQDYERTITIDGMPTELVVRRPSKVFSRTVEASSDPILRQTLPVLLTALHSAARDPACLLSISRVARYVGTRLSAPVPLAEPTTLSIAVLGDPSDRSELRAALLARQKKSPA